MQAVAATHACEHIIKENIMTLFRNEFVRDEACAKEIFRYYVFSHVIVRIMYGFYAFCLGLCIIGGIIIGDFGRPCSLWELWRFLHSLCCYITTYR